MNDKFFVGLRLTALEDNGIRKPVSRVTLLVDDDNALTAGDDTGAELVADCPHATQEMVNSLLAEFKGYQYRAYRADDASLDPAAELGDGVTVGGIYSVVSQISDDGSGYSGITAPGEAELEDEYPSGGPMTQAFDRKIATTRSLISKTAEEIRLEVKDTNDNVASLAIDLDNIETRVKDAEGNISSLTQTATEITTKVTNNTTSISEVRQYAESITLSVSNGPTSSTITLKAGETTIKSQTISMDGLVTFTGLANGTTTIDGDCIKTGTISAARLDLSAYSTTTQIESLVNGMRLSVSNGSTSSMITLLADGAEISSQTISMDGLVTFTGLANGTTRIHGGCIQTGLIDAQYLNLSGAITFGDFSQDVMTSLEDTASVASSAATIAASAATDASTAATTASNALTAASAAAKDVENLANGEYQGNYTFINGTFIYSPTLIGDTITLYGKDSSGVNKEVGRMTLKYSETFAFDLSSELSLRMQAKSGYNTFVGTGDGNPFLLLRNRDTDGSALSTPQCYLGGGALIVDQLSFGEELPSTGITGQVYFLLM